MKQMKHLVVALWCVILSVTAAAAQSNYAIQPGDTLSVEVLEDPTLNRTVLVLPDGRFSFPFVGTVRAGGRTVDQVAKSVASGIASNFAVSPNVFVSVSSLNPPQPTERVAEAPETIDVYFLGEVGAPGLKALQPGTSILQAFASAGGFTRFAAQKRVQLRRTDPRSGKQMVYTINYRALSDGAVMSRDMILKSGDVILVPERRLFE